MSLSQGSRCLSCRHGHGLQVLLPHLAGAIVEEAEPAGGLLCIRARARAGEVACPSCGRLSRRVHSRYERRLADGPVGGRRVVIRLQVRRLFCDAPACGKRTFAEQVPGLTARYERKTALLAGMQRDIAVSLFKQAGLDFETLKKQAQTNAFRAVPLQGVTFSANYRVKHDTVISKNVVGRLPGTAHPDQTLIYSAHWDHLGVGKPDDTGDRIFNGAVDNATGVAALLTGYTVQQISSSQSGRVHRTPPPSSGRSAIASAKAPTADNTSRDVTAAMGRSVILYSNFTS